MTIICVDDEDLVLQLTLSMCRDIEGVDRVEGFSRAGQALEFLEKEKADIAILDVDLPDINGMVLAKRIKENYPNVAIIFLTGYEEFAVGAFKLRVSGYLLKPVNSRRLREEVSYAMDGINSLKKPHISIQTFGNFEITVNGQSVAFPRARSKELLAYLVDRQGGGVTRVEAFSALWEDAEYDRGMQKQFDVIVRGMKDALKKAGIEDILEIKSGSMRVIPEKLDCDLYSLLKGDEEVISAYRGEYMSAYPWSSETEAYLETKFGSGYAD